MQKRIVASLLLLSLGSLGGWQEMRAQGAKAKDEYLACILVQGAMIVASTGESQLTTWFETDFDSRISDTLISCRSRHFSLDATDWPLHQLHNPVDNTLSRSFAAHILPSEIAQPYQSCHPLVVNDAKVSDFSLAILLLK